MTAFLYETSPDPIRPFRSPAPEEVSIEHNVTPEQFEQAVPCGCFVSRAASDQDVRLLLAVVLAQQRVYKRSLVGVTSYEVNHGTAHRKTRRLDHDGAAFGDGRIAP